MENKFFEIKCLSLYIHCETCTKTVEDVKLQSLPFQRIQTEIHMPTVIQIVRLRHDTIAH